MNHCAEHWQPGALQRIPLLPSSSIGDNPSCSPESSVSCAGLLLQASPHWNPHLLPPDAFLASPSICSWNVLATTHVFERSEDTPDSSRDASLALPASAGRKCSASTCSTRAQVRSASGSPHNAQVQSINNQNQKHLRTLWADAGRSVSRTESMQEGVTAVWLGAACGCLLPVHHRRSYLERQCVAADTANSGRAALLENARASDSGDPMF